LKDVGDNLEIKQEPKNFQ